MLSDIKTQFYNILTEDLGYNVTDNPNGEEAKSFPHVRLTLQDTYRDRRKNLYLYIMKLKIDIFSNYNGEKEIYDMEEAIFDASEKLYDNEYISYFRESSFRIIDDKATGVERKHGIITYTFYLTGGVEEENEEP